MGSRTELRQLGGKNVRGCMACSVSLVEQIAKEKMLDLKDALKL